MTAADDAMQAIAAEFGTPQIAADEFTQAMYARHMDIGLVAAKSQIDEAIAAGKLACVGERRLPSGKRAVAYKIA